MKVYNRGYSTPRTVNFGNGDVTFVCDPHYTTQYLMPFLDISYHMWNDEECCEVDLNSHPFSPDNEEKIYFLQCVKVQKREDWLNDRGTYFKGKYGEWDAEEHEYIGSVFCITGDEGELSKLKEKMERSANGDFKEEDIVGYCDLLLFDKNGNVLDYKVV